MIATPTKSKDKTEITYDENRHLVKLTLQGFVSSRNYREAWQEARQIAKENTCPNWMIDLQKFKGTTHRDLEWSFGDWFENVSGQVKCSQNPYDCRASVLLPQDHPTEKLVQNALKNTNPTRVYAKVESFKDERTASTFLLR